MYTCLRVRTFDATSFFRSSYALCALGATGSEEHAKGAAVGHDVVAAPRKLARAEVHASFCWPGFGTVRATVGHDHNMRGPITAPHNFLRGSIIGCDFKAIRDSGPMIVTPDRVAVGAVAIANAILMALVPDHVAVVTDTIALGGLFLLALVGLLGGALLGGALLVGLLLVAALVPVLGVAVALAGPPR